MDYLLNNPTFQSSGYVLPSLLLGLAVGYAIWQFFAILAYPRELLGEPHPFERQRREELRAGNSIYRWLEPMIEEMGAFFRKHPPTSLDDLQHNLVVSREKLPWRPEEFLATKWLEGIASGVVLFLILWLAGWYNSALVLGPTVAVVYALLMPKTIRDRAKRRLVRIRNRLPFAVDLIALTMEAGGGFQECLATAVAENGKGHPLTEEFAEVLRQISLGRPRHEALQALDERLHDDDVSEMVFAINKGEELGTPLSAILREQAEQMRLKRSQRGEKAAAEAQVNIVFPGMVVMIACLLVVIAPILLPPVLALF
jgi:Type II secretion system (T2SS), protein F